MWAGGWIRIDEANEEKVYTSAIRTILSRSDSGWPIPPAAPTIATCSNEGGVRQFSGTHWGAGGRGGLTLRG